MSLHLTYLKLLVLEYFPPNKNDRFISFKQIISTSSHVLFHLPGGPFPSVEILLLQGLAPRLPSLLLTFSPPTHISLPSAKSCPVCSLTSILTAEDQPRLSLSPRSLEVPQLLWMKVEARSSFKVPQAVKVSLGHLHQKPSHQGIRQTWTCGRPRAAVPASNPPEDPTWPEPRTSGFPQPSPDVGCSVRIKD